MIGQREKQLGKRGTLVGFVDVIANDAINLALLKRLSRDYIDGGRKLLDDYRHRSGRSTLQQDVNEVSKAIDNFSDDTGAKLASLDQIIRDMLQLVFFHFLHSLSYAVINTAVANRIEGVRLGIRQ